MAQHNEFGKTAERKAAQFLVDKGYEIIRTNYRWQKAEIDIIASFQNKIIIVEVKALATDVFKEPQASVNKKKIRNLVAAADEFMKENNHSQDVRFDIISVLRNRNGELNITHLIDAFEAFDAN